MYVKNMDIPFFLIFLWYFRNIIVLAAKVRGLPS